ncbi:helicase-related protein [Viridibacillus arvi]|uniref:helicase-related protein n=1 Tax=Viridibacillus arvi TaxID=263475 RepID=UPI003D29EF42
MTNKLKLETAENPKLIETYHQQAYHQTFCYAAAWESGNKHSQKLLMTIVSGSDSTIQAVKAISDIGTYGGITFGYGTKNLTGYQFTTEQTLTSEKGKYESFPMTINRNRKAVAIVHEEITTNSKYVFSFEGNPGKDIAQLLGGSNYGLHILPEWEDIVLEELRKAGYLTEHELYYDQELFPNGIYMYSINMEEEQADRFIEGLIKSKKLAFPSEGSGELIVQTDGLTSYLMNYNNAMIEKLAATVKPIHDPLVDQPLKHFETYNRELFPVQAHTATAIAKRLTKTKVKAVILQGEMSTGKSSMMVAIADGINHISSSSKGQTGYFACVMCPPSLTSKWPDEIRALIPNAQVIVVKKTEDLIKYHQNWIQHGRFKPKQPVFFVISFTTMRNDSAIRQAVSYKSLKTKSQIKNAFEPFKEGFYCPACGKPHQTIDSESNYFDDNGVEQTKITSHNMTTEEFGVSRRFHKGGNPPNAFCFHCGESLWSKTVKNRYSTFAEWTKHEKSLMPAILAHDVELGKQIQQSQPDDPSSIKLPRRISAVEYIRRKMRKFFKISIVDEVHELKGGMTAQGNALGSLAAASQKVIAGTGTLFGGKAEDVYYLLWRLFPNDMANSGYKFEEVTRFNEEFGNIEETSYNNKDGREQSNKQSRGGKSNNRKKVVPGISPFIYGKYMVQNVVNVRLKDVWPEPVELVDTATIFVPMSEELKTHYNQMTTSIEHAINSKENGHRMYTLLTDYGIAYPDNPFQFPDAYFKDSNGSRELIWTATHIDESVTLPKEKKLQDIIETEISEGRKSIVYVRDTGSSVPERDVRPRLKQKLEEIGAKVCVLDTTTTATNKRSEWLHEKMMSEGYDVCIASQELVKVGLDLLCTPTLIYYQFSWSLFTINQSSRRAWRIGQTQECRLFYLAYENSYQQHMADLIARKNRATAAINGEAASSDGLSAMLGDEGDLQSLLINAVKNGGTILKGSAEDWISQQSERSRELLAGIGKKKTPKIIEAEATVIPETELVSSDNEVTPKPVIPVVERPRNKTSLIEPLQPKAVTSINTQAVKKKKTTRRTNTSENQLIFDLFG